MYYEKWGFMLIFWNLAGVPLSYCHCSIYLANHAPSEYRWNRVALIALYTVYLFLYWVWDTTNSQKNRFRQQERGGNEPRKAFPQLPWQTVKNPRSIKTASGDSILVDGWCKCPLPPMPHHSLTIDEQINSSVNLITPATCSSLLVGPGLPGLIVRSHGSTLFSSR